MVRSIAVVVLGDIGRSPRMQYHAISLATSAQFRVDLIGYNESILHNDIVNNTSITVHPLGFSSVPSFISAFFLTRIIYKLFFQIFGLLFLLLFKISSPEFILVQSPPAIPTLAVCYLASLIRGSRFIIDWHNYGYTWMQMNRKGGLAQWFVTPHRIYELIFGRCAWENFCVSEAMAEDLLLKWDIKAKPLHDRPASIFHEISTNEKAALFKKYPFGKSFDSEDSAFVDSDGNLMAQRPALIVSSTSWTADEDFGILLDALVKWDESMRNTSGDSFEDRVRVVITGKGELRTFYEEKIRSSGLKKIRVFTEFLPIDDYARLLASADAGISLHVSSSGLDLPMKVVDMLGCCLPVLAYNYSCLSELVRDGSNGFVFNTSHDLYSLLERLFENHQQESHELESVRMEIRRTADENRWETNWNRIVLPILKTPSPSPSCSVH